jgi:hypothetical protein
MRWIPATVALIAAVLSVSAAFAQVPGGEFGASTSASDTPAPLDAPNAGSPIVTPQTDAAFVQGQRDREAYEIWFRSLSGDYGAGASYWAAHRSVPNSPPCVGPRSPAGSATWTRGCLAAKQYLEAPDQFRHTSPAYRLGWNNPTVVAAADDPNAISASQPASTSETETNGTAAVPGSAPQALAADAPPGTISPSSAVQIPDQPPPTLATVPGTGQTGAPSAIDQIAPLALATAIILFLGGSIYFTWRNTLETRALDAQMAEKRAELAQQFVFILPDVISTRYLCMDGGGRNIIVIHFMRRDNNYYRTEEVNLPISSVNSIELSGGDTMITDYVTTTRKPHGIGRAMVGGILFGGAGALIGSTTAGSRSRSVATQRVIHGASVLTFGLADLSNPLFRFQSYDRAQCEQWLYRVKAAMEKSRHQSSAEAHPS